MSKKKQIAMLLLSGVMLTACNSDKKEVTASSEGSSNSEIVSGVVVKEKVFKPGCAKAVYSVKVKDFIIGDRSKVLDLSTPKETREQAEARKSGSKENASAYINFDSELEFMKKMANYTEEDEKEIAETYRAGFATIDLQITGENTEDKIISKEDMFVKKAHRNELDSGKIEVSDHKLDVRFDVNSDLVAGEVSKKVNFGDLKFEKIDLEKVDSSDKKGMNYVVPSLEETRVATASIENEDIQINLEVKEECGEHTLEVAKTLEQELEKEIAAFHGEQERIQNEKSLIAQKVETLQEELRDLEESRLSEMSEFSESVSVKAFKEFSKKIEEEEKAAMEKRNALSKIRAEVLKSRRARYKVEAEKIFNKEYKEIMAERKASQEEYDAKALAFEAPKSTPSFNAWAGYFTGQTKITNNLSAEEKALQARKREIQSGQKEVKGLTFSERQKNRAEEKVRIQDEKESMRRKMIPNIIESLRQEDAKKDLIASQRRQETRKSKEDLEQEKLQKFDEIVNEMVTEFNQDLGSKFSVMDEIREDLESIQKVEIEQESDLNIEELKKIVEQRVLNK